MTTTTATPGASSTGTLTAQGLGSGLDITSLVSQLVSAEGDPQKTLLTHEQNQITAQISALGALSSALSTLRSSVEKLNLASAFTGLQATSGSQDLFTATAASNAAKGQYQVTVDRLAQAHKLVSGVVASGQTFGGSAGDSLTLTVNGKSVAVDLSQGQTLAEIAGAVNSAADNPGITATLINAGSGQQALVLTSDETGSANQIDVTENTASGASLSLTTANRDASGNALTDLSQLDAQATIDGVTVISSTNQIDNAIDGVTLSLASADPASPTTLTVGADTGSVSSAISSFVNNYNALVGAVSSLSGYQGQGATQPVFFGDSMTRIMSNQLVSELGSSVSGASGRFQTLADIGITTSSDGTLTLDSDKLTQALSTDASAVGSLFSSSQGYATQLDKILSSYVGAGGIIQNRTDGLKSSLDNITNQQNQLSQRLADLQTRYTAEFNAMDTLVGQLTTTSNFLTQQLANLPGAANSNSSKSNG